MAVRTLDDSAWSFPFSFDDEAQLVFAEFTLDRGFSDAPTYADSGITLAILDEAMARAAITVGGAFAMTQTITTSFLRPMRTGKRYRVEAVVDRGSFFEVGPLWGTDQVTGFIRMDGHPMGVMASDSRHVNGGAMTAAGCAFLAAAPSGFFIGCGFGAGFGGLTGGGGGGSWIAMVVICSTACRTFLTCSPDRIMNASAAWTATTAAIAFA